MGDDEEPTIEIVTPQFEREDGVSPDNPPADLEGFRALRRKAADELQEMGLRKWDDETGLMLFPHEWYDAIPEGFEVTNTSYETAPFKHEVRELTGRETPAGGRRRGAAAA